MIISPFAKQTVGRNINKELSVLPGLSKLTAQQRENMFWINARKKIANKSMGAWFRCPECQKYMVGDPVVLQLHMENVHVRGRANNMEKAYRFHPDRYGRNERII